MQWNPAAETYQMLGGGLNNNVAALVVQGNQIYAGGPFTQADTTHVNHVAVWNTVHKRWTALGKGISGGFEEVHALAAEPQGPVYVGGAFTLAGDKPVRNLAMWNGEEWEDVGGGLNGPVHALTTVDGVLYVGGQFTQAGGVAVQNVARWDGRWHAMGGGVRGGSSFSVVHTIMQGDDGVYVGGQFAEAGGQPGTSNIAWWNGDQWHALAGGTDGVVEALAMDDECVWVGGNFVEAGHLPVNSLACWQDGQWQALRIQADLGLNRPVHALATDGERVWAGGHFLNAGGVPARRIAEWSAHQWHQLGEGLNGVANDLAVSDGMLYVGGWFDRAGTTQANNIARWDGATWQALGNGIPERVQEIAVHNDTVYALTDDSFEKDVLYRWEGSTWEAISASLEGQIEAITVTDAGVLYAGVSLSSTTYHAALARWSGNTWHLIGGEIDGRIFSLGADGETLYIAGDFEHANGERVNNIVGWHAQTETWFTLEGGVTFDSGKGGYIIDVFAEKNLVYAGGNFTQAGRKPARSIARWDGESWTAFGKGVGGGNPYVYAVTAHDEEVYTGGLFTLAGGQASYFFGQWTGPPQDPLPDEELPSTSEVALQQNYPNPFRTTTVIEYVLPEAQQVTITVYDILGRRIAVLVEGMQAAQVHRLSWEATGLPGGMYFYTLRTPHDQQTRQMILAR